jgi:hypothetical protein
MFNTFGSPRGYRTYCLARFTARIDLIVREVSAAMTIAAGPEAGERGVSPYLLALLSAREPSSDGMLKWPEGVRCDLLDAPLDACCGVIAHLAAAGAQTCPVAQIGDRLLFLVAEGSRAACGETTEGLPDGVVISGSAERFPSQRDFTTLVGSCWVIPPHCAGLVLPPVHIVIAALRSAYAEYQAAREAKII